MSPIAAPGRGSRVVAVLWPPAVLLLLGGVPVATASGQAPSTSPKEQRVAVGKCLSPAGTLIGREAQANTWRTVPPQAEVFATDRLMALPGDQAEIGFKGGAARLTLSGNVPELSSAAVLESAVTLHANPAVDIDLTLERGRVVLARDKGKDAVKVGLHFQGQSWELVLDEPETAVAAELYGRWPPGAAFRVKPEATDVPVASLVVFVLKGQADLKRGATQQSMRAPPGPASFQWNNVTGPDAGPKHRDRLPPWTATGPRNTPEAKAVQAAVERQRGQLATTPPAEALARSVDQADSAGRQLAVYGLAALDQVARVLAVLESSHKDVREAAVLALEHWIGRGPGQDTKLYQFLNSSAQYSPAQAETFLHLLHGYSRDDMDRPETYETLIAYLRHQQPGIRALAAWHLYRLAPAGRAIAYNPAGSEADRDKAYEEWKKLIPRGKLPPRARPE